ncbi:MAG TPA: hypothetical protein DFS52_12740, partial [Myxococcales bacterium]|nr:hypothetical protein [Myxococcales bacterium]
MHRTVRALTWLMAAAAVASIALCAPATAKPRSAQPMTEVVVAATDLAGNRSEVRQRFTVGGAPPLVEILEPWDGSEAEEAAVTVRVAVTAFSPVASVEIGTGPAEEEGGGIWRAQV